MHSALSELVRREPVTVPLDATIRQALETMERAHVGSIVVTDADRRVPLGVFTLGDLVRRVTLPGGDLAQPIATVMTSGLVALGPGATAHEAALLMARSRVRHLVVVEADGRLRGLVSQNDVFGLQQVGVKEISVAIQGATGVEALRAAALGIRRLAGALMAQGIGAETLTQFLSTLNDLVTVRAIELTVDELELPTVPMCWIALGSEGRLEQTFSTDQDNGIVFEADGEDVDRVREALLPFAREVNRKLDACGFALCKGEIMAGNPRWCLTLDEWKREFSRWIQAPDPRDLLNAAIFFDLRPVYGRAALADALRASILRGAAERPLFLRLLAQNALECQPPLGFLGGFVFDGRARELPHTLDLKMYGSRPFVDAARILSLACGVPQTSTAERLRAADAAVRFGAEDLAGILDGFYFIHLLRLRSQCRPGTTEAGANRLDPDDLNELDRQMLKQAFRQARRLQGRLVREYGLAS
jgi:CBS domain-containing protein